MLRSEEEIALDELPEKIKILLLAWRTATANKKLLRGKIAGQLRLENPKATEAHIKDMLDANTDLYKASLAEGLAESEYVLAYEKLMIEKKKLSARTAF